MRRGDDEIAVKPERDPVTCWCDREAEVATPAGPLCREHADDLAEQLEDDL